jgi:hypothetical protein
MEYTQEFSTKDTAYHIPDRHRRSGMAVVKELNIRGAKVLIHDDYIRSPEESSKIMKEFNVKASRFLAAKYRRLAMEAENANEPEVKDFTTVTTFNPKN